jgi:hypothetical protein
MNVLNANAQRKQKMEAAAPVVVREPWLAVKADRVELVKPTIDLNGYTFLDRAGTQKKVLMPERAYIAHGIVVIEEMGLWLPLSAVSIGRK